MSMAREQHKLRDDNGVMRVSLGRSVKIAMGCEVYSLQLTVKQTTGCRSTCYMLRKVIRRNFVQIITNKTKHCHGFTLSCPILSSSYYTSDMLVDPSDIRTRVDHRHANRVSPSCALMYLCPFNRHQTYWNSHFRPTYAVRGTCPCTPIILLLSFDFAFSHLCWSRGYKN